MHSAGEAGEAPLGMTRAAADEETVSGRQPETVATHIGPSVLCRGTVRSWTGPVG